ncbi:bifunctional orotidine-5'-phosphate decarboxylase/orotate phosphoribosyltransferase [Anthocerotibacter panamensis]|uniref:bifunctional orotidine-5'-phosphate decarboxylase/orotate phosphoribosyltransferase n=1 Tax=Anthocerotibacter panamensis TaxID=2857077 RepID=UPI001C4073BB|nr:bifunctional orotidine-5'-phosphate decarboxylase/orotate phosphoribosyltransferase [Anthocerotibacter panamensis]
MDFHDKLDAAIERNQSLLCLGLDPDPEFLLPKFCKQTDNEIADLADALHALILETSSLVCAYKPTLGFYLALGSMGITLLVETLARVPADIPVILDAKYACPTTSTVFARNIFTHWGVDAVTLSPYAGQDQIAPFLLYPGKMVFVLCRTANPSAKILQEYPAPEAPLYAKLVQQGRTWGTPEQLGFEVAATEPAVLSRVRALAPERLLLARGVWQEGGDLLRTLEAGLTSHGDGLLIPVPQALLADPQPAQQIEALRDQINQTRTRLSREDTSCQVWLPDVCLLQDQPHLDLVLQLYDLGCIMFGDYVQASGATFPYYIDLRTIISNPQVFQRILSTYAQVLQGLTFDRIAGIPYGSLPTAAGLALRLHRPMIFPRKEVKAHGTRRVVEGNFEAGETVVVVDDILITGKSAMEGAEKLKSVGLEVRDIVVFIDHEQGVKHTLAAHGYCAHAVLTISEVVTILYQAGRLKDEQFHVLSTHLA